MIGKGASEIVYILAEDDVKISCWCVIRTEVKRPYKSDL